MSSNPDRTGSSLARLWPLALLALFALRLPHFGRLLDDPHSWRQCDTVHYSYDLARHGFDVLHPRVCWLGGHGTLIFEFPLPEAIAAACDRLFGFTPLWDRLVALAFTALSAFWLHRFVRDIAGTFEARVTTATYLLLPLCQFFSRAPQVDFAAQAFAHGLLYHGWRSARGGGAPHALAAAACGALVALIKGPYLAPVLVPLAVLAFSGGLATLAGPAFAVGVSAVAFVAWRRYVNTINEQVPNWTFLPGFYKEVNPWWWYIGELRDRFVPGNWLKLARRFVFEIATPAGVLLAACAPWWRRERGEAGPPAALIGFAWLAGAFAYLLVFFPLSVIHNYYQVPFLAPIALLIALGLRVLTRASAPLVRGLAWAAFAGLVALALVLPTRLGWYRVDEVREAAGRAIAAAVPAQDLVIVVDHGSEFTDPRLLFRAGHDGWPLKAGDVTPQLLAQLHPLGARWLAWVEEPGVASLVPPAFLIGRPSTRAELGAGAKGTPLGVLHLWKLAAPAPAAGGAP